MKIVSWNCSGKFRDKVSIVQSINADIYVIQECENPLETHDEMYTNFASNSIWTGESKNKGLGIFAKDDIDLAENKWNRFCLRCFISARINNAFDLVGVWACNPYIEEYYLYQCVNIKNYSDSTIVIGDFNSNTIWDKKNGTRNHSTVVKELEQIGLDSAYHYQTREMQGTETSPTFFMHRNTAKPYHIDHCFIRSNRVRRYLVCRDYEYWLKYSDHIPIVLEI